MNTTTPRYRRGDPSPVDAGLVFKRYDARCGKEIWVTPEALELIKVMARAVNAKQRAKPEHKVKMREYFRTYNQKPEQKAYHSEYYKQPHVRARIGVTTKERFENDPQFKVARICRGRINAALRTGGIRKTHPTIKLLGCSFEFFRGWMEAHFTDGMTWENYGSRAGQWEIDHTTPVVRFDLTDPVQLRQAFHFSNCKPMWAKENRAKNDFIEHNGKTVRARDLRKVIPFQLAA